MTKPIISVENLSKQYILGGQRSAKQYTALRDELTGSIKRLLSFRVGRRDKASDSNRQDVANTFWALDEVNFEVTEGEVIGVIGHNGAGKSTLLKILSRITEPTRGKVVLRGRVASLLEVGTGFHPELTGRENIFLNGAILGMSRPEILRKLDDIVSFAEVEKFLDTPVKRYSSGMYVRLAFAIAAHLDPEILIVDEVLAVGDAAFQKRCLGKMNEVSRSGRTVLFVSHNLAMMQELCTSAILLSAGKLTKQGDTRSVIEKYLSANSHERQTPNSRYIQSINVTNERGNPSIDFGEDLIIDIRFAPGFPAGLGINMGFQNELGHKVCLFSTNPHDGIDIPLGCSAIHLRIPNCRFAPGRYLLDLAITDPGFSILESLPAFAEYSISPKALGGNWPYDLRFGDYFPDHSWTVR